MNINKKIDLFKNRNIKANQIFTIEKINKNVAFDFIKKYHYLGDAKFFSIYNYGLYIDDFLVGVATYSNPQGISSLKSWFGLDNDNKTVLELSRLCILPLLNGSNATSYLLSNSIKKLKEFKIQAIITLADDSRHIGSIYQICNFKYYGLTSPRSDFYSFDGKINPRGTTKNVRGVWIPRTRKHRYAYIIDKKLKPLLNEMIKPSEKTNTVYICCNGTNKVYDNRFNEWFDCPKCQKKI